MNEDLWRQRWAEGRIGFHAATPNSFLRAHVEKLFDEGGTASGRVLVPLAGKSTDLRFLADVGFDVLGVELVRDAAEAFFREQGLSPSSDVWNGFDVLVAGGVRLAIGDFFALALPDSARCNAAYDRAALIAVTPEERERYVATLLAALHPGARLLLITLAVLGIDAGGPPFSVTETDVKRLFAGQHISLLEESDITANEPRFTERGATRVLEHAWLVTKR